MGPFTKGFQFSRGQSVNRRESEGHKYKNKVNCGSDERHKPVSQQIGLLFRESAQIGCVRKRGTLLDS